MKTLMPFRKKRLRGRHTRKRLSRWQRFREYVWPSMGLRSFLRLVELRVKRQQDAQHRVALGLSIGVFVGFIPTFGQPLLSILLAMLLRGNAVMAAIGSFVGNMWTFPLLFAWNYAVGNAILFHDNPHPFPHMREFFHILFSLEELKEEAWTIFLPTFVGGIVLGLLCGAVVYIVTRINVASYQRARAAFLRKRRALHQEHRQLWHKLPPRHVRK